MTIEAVRVYKARVERKTPFKTSMATQTHVDAVYIELQTSTGIIGVGEAAPRPHINGETLDGAFEQVTTAARELLGMSAADARQFVTTATIGSSAKMGMEAATLDALAQAEGVPICDIIGIGRRERVDYCGFVGSGRTGQRLGKQAARMLKKGYKIVRVKVGELDFEQDLERVRILREKWGDKVQIWLDVNQAWQLDDAIGYCQQLEQYGVMMLEQPLPEDQYDEHAQLRGYTSIPIMIDEGVQTLDDLEHVIRVGAGSAVNLKILKLGTADSTAAAITRAAEAGLEVYCGGTAVTDVFAAYARHVEFGLAGLTYFSTGIPRSGSLVTNPSEPKVAFASDGAYATRPTVPGLGIRLNKEALEPSVVEKWEA